MAEKQYHGGDARRLLSTVITGGYCVGCGACASVKDSPFRVRLDSLGMFQAVLDETSASATAETGVSKVCPFSDDSVNEDVLAKPLFSSDCQYHDRVGYYLSTYVGHVAEQKYREAGSSGGFGTWVQCELLREGLIDAAIQVQPRRPTSTDRRLFAFSVSRKADEILAGAKSRYYPTEMSQIVHYMRENPARYAVTAIPCFAKALRLLGRREPDLAERIAFVIGLFCGHLKSTAFAASQAWQLGIHPSDLVELDFRKKLPNRPANRYGVETKGRVGDESGVRVSPVDELVGSNWTGCFFMYKACDFCDDVMAETADVAVGDAWLPQYVGDSEGTNVLVVRDRRIDQLIRRAIKEQRLDLAPIAVEEVVRSQAGGLRHRREGLRYRLHLADRLGQWRPRKRVEASARHLFRWERETFVYRQQIRDESHRSFAAALAANDLSLFTAKMREMTAFYYSIRPPRWRSLPSRIKRRLLRLMPLLRKS